MGPLDRQLLLMVGEATLLISLMVVEYSLRPAGIHNTVQATRLLLSVFLLSL